MGVADRATQLADAYTSADPTNWFLIEGPAEGRYRVQVQSDNDFSGNTVEVQLKDTDGSGGTAITLEAGVTALGATDADLAYVVNLSDGDQVRLSPSGAGTLHVALVPLCNATVTEQV